METPNKAEHNLHSTFAKITYLVFKLIFQNSFENN